MHFLTLLVAYVTALQPHMPKHLVWASSVSLAATQEIDFLFLPWVTEMFHFSQFAHLRLCIQRSVPGHNARRVAPFGDRRVKGCFRLTDAYRR